MQLTSIQNGRRVISAGANSLVGFSRLKHRAYRRSFNVPFFVPTFYGGLRGGIERCAVLCDSLLTPRSLPPLISSFCGSFFKLTQRFIMSKIPSSIFEKNDDISRFATQARSLLICINNDENIENLQPYIISNAIWAIGDLLESINTANEQQWKDIVEAFNRG